MTAFSRYTEGLLGVLPSPSALLSFQIKSRHSARLGSQPHRNPGAGGQRMPCAQLCPGPAGTRGFVPGSECRLLSPLLVPHVLSLRPPLPPCSGPVWRATRSCTPGGPCLLGCCRFPPTLLWAGRCWVPTWPSLPPRVSVATKIHHPQWQSPRRRVSSEFPGRGAETRAG